jgi:hypothetical protein
MSFMSIHVYAGTSIISTFPRGDLESIDDIRFASLCNANGIAGVESPSENGRDIVAIAACMLDDEIVASSCRFKKIVTVSLFFLSWFAFAPADPVSFNCYNSTCGWSEFFVAGHASGRNTICPKRNVYRKCTFAMLESVHCLIGCFESVHPFAENDALT